MKTSNIYEAKTRLSEIVNAVINGEEWAISRNGTPLVMLVPIAQRKKKIRLGAFKGRIKISADFNAALSESELSEWQGQLFPKNKRK